MVRGCAVDFEGSQKQYLPFVEFSYNNSYYSNIKMTPYEALYGRKCRTPLYRTKSSEGKTIGQDLVRQIKEKVRLIKERLKTASDRKKSQIDLKKRDIEYDIGDKVFPKVSPWKKILRFGKKGKLNSQFIGPFEAIERVGPLAYRLALPPDLDPIHNISMYQY